jgi:putative nucleotidyltransferase with HDIG domain
MDAEAARMKKAQAMIEEISDLPTIPQVATQVLALLEKPDVEIDEVADLILTDQVLAARVIKIVNSPFYKSSQDIKSVKRALVYLGFRHIRELTLTCSFIDAFEGKDGVFDVRTFWEHSFGVGVVAKLIAQRVRYHDTEKAYLGGIIHDLGEVVLSYYMKEQFQKAVDSIKGQPYKLRDAEAKLFGTTHAEVGLCIAKKWNFPPEYCEIIAYHHEPEKATVDPTLAAIINLADLFCSVRQLDYGGKEWVTFNLAEEKAWEYLRQFSPHLVDFDVERFCYELDDKVPEIQELVTSIFKGFHS